MCKKCYTLRTFPTLLHYCHNKIQNRHISHSLTVRTGASVNAVYTSISTQAYFVLTLNYRVYSATEGSNPPRMHARIVFALCYRVTSSETSYNVPGLLNVSPHLFLK